MSNISKGLSISTFLKISTEQEHANSERTILLETSARHQIQRISVVTCIDTEHCNAQLPQFQKQRATNSSSNENSLSLLYCKMRSLPNKFTHKFTKKSGIYLSRIFLPKLKLVYLSQERKQRSQKIY